MKYLCCLLLTLASTAFATSVGDTYQQVLAENGEPRSQVAAGTRRVLQYFDVAIVLRDNRVVSIKPAADAPPTFSPPAPVALLPGTRAEKMAAVRKTLDDAVVRVQQIVNQPVRQLPNMGDMQVAVYSPGWFHDGAIKPDFNTVDVRTTQEASYDSHEYVTSDLNPGVAFVGRELEFNPMTKYFYTDRSVPKKKLTEAEMLEINRLYRIIGQCEQQLGQL